MWSKMLFRSVVLQEFAGIDFGDSIFVSLVQQHYLCFEWSLKRLEAVGLVSYYVVLLP